MTPLSFLLDVMKNPNIKTLADKIRKQRPENKPRGKVEQRLSSLMDASSKDCSIGITRREVHQTHTDHNDNDNADDKPNYYCSISFPSAISLA